MRRQVSIITTWLLLAHLPGCVSENRLRPVVPARANGDRPGAISCVPKGRDATGCVNAATSLVTSPTPAATTPALAPATPIRGMIRLDPQYLLDKNLLQSSGDARETVLAVRRTGQGGLAGNDSASLIGSNGGALVGNDSASLIGSNGGALVGNDSASLVGSNGATIIGAAADQGRGVPVSTAQQWRGLAFRIAEAEASLPGVTGALPVAGMAVQLLDLTTGAPIRMVDSAGRIGNTVLSDAQGQYKLFLPEAIAGNVLVRAFVPGHLDDGRARYGVLTSNAAEGARDIDPSSSLVAFYCRRVFRRYLKELIDDGGMIAEPGQAPDPVLEFLKTKASAVMTGIKDAGVSQWPEEERRLVAQHVSDHLLGSLEDLHAVPVPEIAPDTPVPVALLTVMAATPTPERPRATAEIQAVLETLRRLAETKPQEGYPFDTNIVLQPIYAAIRNFRQLPSESQPDWLPQGELAILQPADLPDLAVRAFFFSTYDELRRIKVMDDAARARLVKMGLPKTYQTDKTPKAQFLSLLISLGVPYAESETLYFRLEHAALSILGAILVQVAEHPASTVAELKRLGTPAGRESLKRSSVARYE